MKLRFGLIGYGRMGRQVENVALQRGHVVSRKYDLDSPFLPDAKPDDVDVLIEFSHPDSVLNSIELALKYSIPIVVGATGWRHKIKEVERNVHEAEGSLFYAENFSVGMNIFYRIINAAATLCNRFEEYDPFVHELHHREKIDSPSGTALSLADIILKEIERKTEVLPHSASGKIKAEQLHVTSTRGGSTPGSHIVSFDSEADTIELKHAARNRSGFALGAVYAAEWLIGKKGVFCMDDLLS